MSMYFYCLVALLVSCSALVAADTCYKLNATFTIAPQICYPTYNISELYAQNSTVGDRLSSFFTYLSSSANLPAEECGYAFAAYYCSQSYPECDGTGTSKPACASNCSAVVTACANYTDVFGDPLFPEFTLPLASDCAALSEVGCSVAPPTNLSTFYANCQVYDLEAVTKVQLDSRSPTDHVSTPVCQPDYTVPAGNLSYYTGAYIWEAFVLWSMDYSLAPVNENDTVIPNWYYPCAKALANFWCGSVYPACPEEGVLPVLPLCRSVCETVLDVCNATITQWFDPDDPYGFVVPTKATCDAITVNNATVNCFAPTGTWTNMTYFFSSDPPLNVTPTDAPTRPPYYYSTTGIQYPPGGAAKGGGIGAAVLVGILIFIGLLMLIMKKQDSR